MEYVDIVSEDNKIIDKALRSECHGNPKLIHRAAHVLVLNSHGHLLLQKRSMNKDIQPGKWDTSVGGHVESGESYEKAAYRELEEELGVKNVIIDYLYDYKMRNEIESENIRSYLCKFDGHIDFNQYEIDEVRFWEIEEIKTHLGTGIFTPNFEQEFTLYLNSKPDPDKQNLKIS
jgi:isopentenyl-diphosphate delta-isomerase type 1